MARYDKIHLFDVSLDNGERHSESAHYEAGQQAIIADLPYGKLGMTVCYDVRFPALYHVLASWRRFYFCARGFYQNDR